MKLSELSNPQIATLAVSRLGGETKAIGTEDIAIEAYKLFPQKFCWRKFPDRIDIAIVRFALSDAAKRDLALLRGNNKDGWMLSPKGLKWINSLPLDFEDGAEGEAARRGSVLAALETERLRLYQSNAFAKYFAGQSKQIALKDFQEFVRINEYFPERKRQERFAAVQNAAIEDERLKLLWRFLKRKFKKEFVRNEK